MKRTIYYLVPALVLVLLLAGCGRKLEETPAPAEASATTLPAEGNVDDTGDTGEAGNEGAAEDSGSAATDENTAVGDAANGEALFHEFQDQAGFACSICHNTDSAERLVGPGLLGVSERAATRVEGMSAVEYLHTSILDPSAYVVDDFPDQLMPQIYSEIFSEAQINDLVAYLLTL